MWQPDGWAYRARLGVIVPHAAVGTESELAAMLPPGVSLHAARVPFAGMRAGGEMDPTIALEPVRAFADPPYLDDAAALLAAAPIDAIGVGFTASSLVRGVADDEAVRQRLEARGRGLPVAVTSASAALALRALGTTRLAFVAPPWFPPALTELGARYFAEPGIAIVHAAAVDLPSDQQAIHPGNLFAGVRRAVPENADAVFIAGNGLRAVGVIAALEEDLGIPVLTANQVLLWHLLRLARTRVPVTGYGQLFSLTLP